MCLAHYTSYQVRKGNPCPEELAESDVTLGKSYRPLCALLPHLYNGDNLLGLLHGSVLQINVFKIVRSANGVLMGPGCVK